MDSAASTSSRPPLAAIRRTAAPQSRQQRRRHAPYARPADNSQRPNSLADRALGICKQISKPLFGRGAMLNSPDDAFVAPWRTVDRETYELREELLKAQCEATAFDQTHQGKQTEEKANACDTANNMADSADKALSVEGGAVDSVSDDPPVAPAQSAYESVFATARKMAERRATGLAGVEQASSKGKEADRSLPVAASDEDDEEDNDFEPQDAEGEADEEEALQRDMEPIDEAEEVTTPAGSANEQSSAAASCVASPSNSQMTEPLHLPESQESESESDSGSELSVASSETSGQSIELSVDEESSSADEDSASESERDDEVALPASIEEPLDFELSSEADEAETKPEAESEPDEVAVQVLEDEGAGLDNQDVPGTAEEAESSSGEDDSDAGSVSDESDRMTEEIATMPSEDDLSEAESEAASEVVAEAEAETGAEAEDEAEPVAPKAKDSAFTSPSRSWWPFSGRSLFSGQDSAHNDQPSREKPETAARETASDSEESSRPEPTKRKSDELLATSDNYVQAPTSQPFSAYARRRQPQRTSSVQAASPYVPASFIDFSKNAMSAMGKRMRSVERSGLRHASRRHTPTTPVPVAEESSIAADYAPLPTSPKRGIVSGAKRANTAAEAPAITAASLGLEARRSIARGHSLQQRRRASVYYGSGYGSCSTPYAYNIAHSTPEAVAPSARPAQAAGASDGVSGARGGSITAQKILDIISEVPPARSQMSLEPHDIINPYELSSPYSVRMRPAATQRRRVLVPLSMRLSQSSSADSAKTVTQPTGGSSARAILESIQSAAPPEVQAGLGSMGALKAIQANRQTPKRYLPPPLPTKKSTNAPSPTANKGAAAVVASQPHGVASPKSITKTLSSTSPSSLAARLAAKGQPAPTPLDQLAMATAESATQTPKQPVSLGAPKPVTKTMAAESATSTPPPPVKTQFSTPKHGALTAHPVAKSTAAQPPPMPKIRETAVAPADRPTPKPTIAALATSEVQLPVFSFVLPKTPAIGRSSAAKRKAEGLSVSQLPSFAFTLEATMTRSASQPTAKLTAAPAADWTCDECELKSPPDAKQCIVCEAPKSAPKPALVPPVVLPATNSWAGSGFTPAAPKDGEWVCDTCELKNSLGASKCTVCDAAKPATKPAAATAVVPVPNLWAQSGFKVAGLKDGEWTCDTCELKNQAASSKCTVCDSPKPGPIPSAAAPVAAPAPNLWEQSGFKVAGLKDGEWTCDTCELKNSIDASKCTVCDSAKPGPIPSAAAPVAAPAPNLWAQSGFKVAGPKDGEWTCDICELKNQAASSKCTVCDAAKPAQKSAAPSTAFAASSAKERASNLDASQLPVFSFNLDVSKKPTAPKC